MIAIEELRRYLKKNVVVTCSNGDAFSGKFIRIDTEFGEDDVTEYVDIKPLSGGFIYELKPEEIASIREIANA